MQVYQRGRWAVENRRRQTRDTVTSFRQCRISAENPTRNLIQIKGSCTGLCTSKTNGHLRSYSWKKQGGWRSGYSRSLRCLPELLLSVEVIFGWNEFSALTCQAPCVGCLVDTQVWLLKSGEIQFHKISSKAEVNPKFLYFPWWGKQSNMMNKMRGNKFWKIR